MSAWGAALPRKANSLPSGRGAANFGGVRNARQPVLARRRLRQNSGNSKAASQRQAAPHAQLRRRGPGNPRGSAAPGEGRHGRAPRFAAGPTPGRDRLSRRARAAGPRRASRLTPGSGLVCSQTAKNGANSRGSTPLRTVSMAAAEAAPLRRPLRRSAPGRASRPAAVPAFDARGASPSSPAIVPRPRVRCGGVGPHPVAARWTTWASGVEFPSWRHRRFAAHGLQSRARGEFRFRVSPRGEERA